MYSDCENVTLKNQIGPYELKKIMEKKKDNRSLERKEIKSRKKCKQEKRRQKSLCTYSIQTHQNHDCLLSSFIFFPFFNFSVSLIASMRLSEVFSL